MRAVRRRGEPCHPLAPIKHSTRKCNNVHNSLHRVPCRDQHNRITAYLFIHNAYSCKIQWDILSLFFFKWNGQLKWYGHFLRMEDNSWPKTIYQWTLHGRRRRARPQQSWKNQVTAFMRSRNMDMLKDLWCLGTDRRVLAVYIYITNSMAYETRRFNAAFTRALQ